MVNDDIARIFGRIADLMEIKGENRYKILAYRRAAETIPSFSEDLSALSINELTELPGIGQALAEKILEYISTGNLKFLQDLEKEVPPTLLDLLKIPGLGHKRVSLFWHQVGVTTIDELEDAARKGKLRELSGMGEKSESRLLEGIESYKISRKRSSFS